MHLSSNQKQSLLKIAVDLVKADNQIHRNEVAALDNLIKRYQITPEEIELTHYFSLQQAITSLSHLDEGDKELILKQLSNIISVDNDISSHENILLSSVSLSLRQDSSSWVRVISVENINKECSNDQIIYLERGFCSNAHLVLDDKYDNLLITKALNDIGLRLFYLPNVITELAECQSSTKSHHDEFDLLGRSIGFIVPKGETNSPSSLKDLLHNLNTERFLKIIETYYNMSPDLFSFDAFLLVKIQDGHTFDDSDNPIRTVDFLCIDVSSDMKKHILTFVNLMEKTVNLIPYEGYYKMLYDHLSNQSKIMSVVMLDDKNNFFLPDLNNYPIKFESSPQARSFYLLLLKFGKIGISKKIFSKSLVLLESAINDHTSGEELLSYLTNDGSEPARLLYDLILLYSTLSNKSPDNQAFYNYIRSIIQHRSSLKNYINKGFLAVPHLANHEQYCVDYNNDTKSYVIRASAAMFGIQTHANGTFIPLIDSYLWKKLW